VGMTWQRSGGGAQSGSPHTARAGGLCSPVGDADIHPYTIPSRAQRLTAAVGGCVCARDQRRWAREEQRWEDERTAYQKREAAWVEREAAWYQREAALLAEIAHLRGMGVSSSSPVATSVSSSPPPPSSSPINPPSPPPVAALVQQYTKDTRYAPRSGSTAPPLHLSMPPLQTQVRRQEGESESAMSTPLRAVTGSGGEQPQPQPAQ
jgi:hypothetical protein